MAAAELAPIYWPESFAENEGQDAPLIHGRIVHLRHRVGDYDVTRIILEPLPPQPEPRRFY
jgi:hypothetical protein